MMKLKKSGILLFLISLAGVATAKNPIWVKPCVNITQNTFLEPQEFVFKAKATRCFYSPASHTGDAVTAKLTVPALKTGVMCAKDSFFIEPRASGECFSVFTSSSWEVNLSYTENARYHTDNYYGKWSGGAYGQTIKDPLIDPQLNDLPAISAKPSPNMEIHDNKLAYLIFNVL